MRSHKTKFKLLPEWAIKQSGKSLKISGGADSLYEVELESDKQSFFSELSHEKAFSRSDLAEDDRRVLEELLTAEIVVPIFKKTKQIKVMVIGDSADVLPEQNPLTVKNSQEADLLVVVRTNSSYSDLLAKTDYVNITKPHLFIDLAFHHSLSLGPLVFPGETACIACLQGRVSTRWGDEIPPRTPLVGVQYKELIAGLLHAELDRIVKGDVSLTNKTITWNFHDRLITKNQLLKVPLCPICSQNVIDQRGALALPWGKDESLTNTV